MYLPACAYLVRTLDNAVKKNCIMYICCLSDFPFLVRVLAFGSDCARSWSFPCRYFCREGILQYVPSFVRYSATPRFILETGLNAVKRRNGNNVVSVGQF